MSEYNAKENGHELSHAESVEKVRDIIKDIKIAMLVTTDEHGTMSSRPFYTQETEFDGDLWFMTSKSSSVVTQLRQNPAVLVNYASADSQRFVVIAGDGTIVHDQAKIEELWNPSLKMWFKGGPTDPEIALLKIEARRADFWDSPSAPVRWFQFLAGVATGKRPSGDQRGEVDL